MLNESLFLLSFDELKELLLHGLTIFHIAVVYVLMYVTYKALGRYIYFKPQEHASKINRTFLTLSLLIVLLHSFSGLINYFPFLPEYRWFYALCGLVVFIAPLSIIMDRLVWKYDHNGFRYERNWCSYYLPLSNDYYKTSISKSESDGRNINSWEEEGVQSTKRNIHSDALLNILASIVFISISGIWAHESYKYHGCFSYIFSAILCLTITGIFLDSAVFSWIHYLERNVKIKFKKK